jgi:glycosyltransferase involved in cell wall biosynthesis
LASLTGGRRAMGARDLSPASGRLAGVSRRPDGNPSPHVLHVVESLASGVATAIEDYVRSTPSCTHSVLGWRRSEAQTGDNLDVVADQMFLLPRGRVAQVRAVRRHIRLLRPDIVHAHSSYAGLYVRLFTTQPGRSLVYTPHGFSFQRRDVSALARFIFWLVEAALSYRGAHVAAVGPREAELAARLPGRPEVTYVPHVVSVPDQVTPPVDGIDKPPGLRVATLGRITAAKDPDFLRHAALAGQAADPPISWLWVGGGDPADEAALREAGVVVTGWMPRPQALGWLKTADLYVHTAIWEGSPISILEAAALGLPVIARRSPALRALDLSVLFDTPEELVQLATALADEGRRADLRARSRRLLDRHQPAAQRAALQRIYRLPERTHPP